MKSNLLLFRGYQHQKKQEFNDEKILSSSGRETSKGFFISESFLSIFISNF